MSAEDIRKALTRMSHEILERVPADQNLVLVGLHTRGVPLAHRIANHIEHLQNIRVPVGSLDIGLYRDDLRQKKGSPLRPTEIPLTLDGTRVVLVDDVLFTGRSVRAALDGLVDFGRPQQIQLAVLVDRGHREFPIKADYVGKNLPTSIHEVIQVHMTETDGTDEVVVLHREQE